MPQNRSSAEQALNHPFVTRAYKQDIGTKTCIPDPNYISSEGEIIQSMMIAPDPVDLAGNDTVYLTSVNLSGVNEGCVTRNLTPDDLGTTFDDIDTEELQKGGLIPRIDPGTSRAPKKSTNNKMKYNHIIDRDKTDKLDKSERTEKIENVQRVKNTYVQEDILAADNTNSTVSLPRSAWIDADAGVRTNLLKRDDSNLPHASTSITTTASTTGRVHDQAQVQVAVTATSTSIAPVCGASYSVLPDAHTLHHHHQSIPQSIPQNVPQVEEHSVANVNVKTRESKRKLTAMQQSVAVSETTAMPQKRNLKRRGIDEREKEREGEGGRGGVNKEVKEVVSTTHVIHEKATQGKAKMRLGDNISSSSSSSYSSSSSSSSSTAAAAIATSQSEVTKKITNSIPNKRGLSSRYIEVSGQKGVGEKEKGAGERGRGEKGGSRDCITEIETENKAESRDMKTELDVKRPVSSSATVSVGGGGDNRRHSKRERPDTKCLQQQQQQLLQQQHQMIVCGRGTESSFLSQEDSNTTVETASQSSCDWYVPYVTIAFLILSSFNHTLSLSPSHTHAFTLTLTLSLGLHFILSLLLFQFLLLSLIRIFILSLLLVLFLFSYSFSSSCRSSAKDSQITEPLSINFFE